MLDSSALTTAIDEHVFLIGRPPVGEFLGFIRSLAVNGQSREQGDLVAQWRDANDHVRQIESGERGIADRSTVAPMPAELEPQCARILSDPVTRRAFQLVPSHVGIVELDRLVVYQKHIDLTHVRKIQERIPEDPTIQQLLDLCIPMQRHDPPVRLIQNAPNSYSFISTSNDFRFLQSEVLQGEQISDAPVVGSVTGVLGLMLGYGMNYVNVIATEGRLILGNGSHRAYALRERGVTHIPAIVQTVSRREELELVAPADLVQHPDRFLRAARPPLLKDYFDPRLRMIVPVARKHRMIRISFGIETVDIPAH